MRLSEKCARFLTVPYAELSRIRRAGDMDESLVQRVELLTDIFHELGEEIPESQIDAEAAMIEGMRRR